MNIEEERKAFKESMQGLCPISNDWEFRIWMAAKAHAAEMAKPVATYSTFNDLVVLYGKEKTYFKSVADAKVWASNNGYRVVDE